jgi:hypothetical protein
MITFLVLALRSTAKKAVDEEELLETSVQTLPITEETRATQQAPVRQTIAHDAPKQEVAQVAGASN